MEKHQFGFRRLSLACGVLGAAIWGFLTFMEVIDFGYGHEGKILWGFLFSFFLPWGIVRAIPWLMQGFKGQITKGNETQFAENEGSLSDIPTEAFPTDTPSHYHPQFSAIGVRLDATEKKLKRTQWGNLIIMCLLIFILITTIKLLTGNQVLRTRGLLICDKLDNPRIKFYTNYESDKPYINFINDKNQIVSTIDETGHWWGSGTKQLPQYEELFIPIKPIPKTK